MVDTQTDDHSSTESARVSKHSGVRITKEVEFDAGHRVPNHTSKCRNPHGHRYRVVAHCVGTIVMESGASDEGMLIDFGDLKHFLIEYVHDIFDHGFIVYSGDLAMGNALGWGGDHDWKVIEFPLVPTAENLARWIYDVLHPLLENHYRDNLRLEAVEVWETPTSMAYYPVRL